MQQPESRPATHGFFQNLAGLYTAPMETFRSILDKPRVLIPLLVLVAISLTFTALWVSKVDPVEFMREQLEASNADLTPEQKAEAIEGQSKLIPIMAWVGALVFGPALCLFAAAVYLAVFRFIFGATLSFVQSLAVVVWSSLAVSLVQTPLLALVMAAKGDWNADPNTALRANLTLLLDRENTSAWLYSLAGNLDLFSFWLLGLVAAGYAVASGRTIGSVLPGVLGPWLIYVLASMGGALLF